MKKVGFYGIPRLPPMTIGADFQPEDTGDPRARILLIEDDELIRETVAEILTRAGYDVGEAANGAEGLKLLEHDRADIVITDIYMPEKEGLETIIDIRRLYPDTRIIAMSGGGESGLMTVLNFAEKLGAARVLRKPFLSQDIIDAIESLLAEQA